MPFDFTWDAAFEATPAGSDNAADGDDAIRNLKAAFRERFDVDHSIQGDSSDGQHKRVTFKLNSGDPSVVANRGYLYTKDNSLSKVSLFWMDEDGNVIQLTEGARFLAGGMIGTDASANAGPSFRLMRRSPSPAVNDFGGEVRFVMYNAGLGETTFANIVVQAHNVTGGATAGELQFQFPVAGALATKWHMGPWLYVEGLTKPAAGIINCNGFEVGSKPIKGRYYGTTLTMNPIAANTGVNAAHGMGAAGDGVELVLENITTELGYVAGQLVSISDSLCDNGLVSGTTDATIVYLAVGAMPRLRARDGASQSAITPANWKLHALPYRKL